MSNWWSSIKNQWEGRNKPNGYRKTLGGMPDYTYRDIYSKRPVVRGKKPQPTSKKPSETIAWFFIILFCGFTLLVASMFFGVLGRTYGAWAGLPLSDFPNGPVDALEDLLIPFRYDGTIWIFSWSCLGMGSIFIYSKVMQNWKAQNEANDTTDINTYETDARIEGVHEMTADFDIVPDAGAHTGVPLPNAILAHIPSTNAGIHHIWVAKRLKQDEYVRYDENGDIHKITKEQYLNNKTGDVDKFLKGDYQLNSKGNIIYERKPMFDQKFMQALWTASGLPKDNRLRIFYSPKEMPYNPGKVLGKQNQKNVAQHINADWTYPTYERERPAGYYVVDTTPSNAMMIAMTRAGKGQTYIEPMIDVWTRCRNRTNVVINDPKGELYVEFFYPANKRGFEVVPFNLINVADTSQYNPLDYAVEASRHGDNQKVEQFIGDIGNVFFPKTKQSDPMWPDAANAAFKRAAFGLIDYYQDRDTRIRNMAVAQHWSVSTLNEELDHNWAHVSPNYVYQFMTQLAGVVSTDPSLIHVKPDDPKRSKDLLTLFFDAEKQLPTNSLRTSTLREDSSLRAMAGSDKTIASVYGISLTAMKFFADDRIAALTSGPPSQNFDMAGLAFPRRIQIQLSKKFLDRHHLEDQTYRWHAYKDPHFQHQYKGNDFYHADYVDPNGWMSYIFKGIFQGRTAYLKLDLYEHRSNQLIDTYYFQFAKDFRKTANGDTYIVNPVTKSKDVHGGFLREMKPIMVGTGANAHIKKVNGKPQFKFAHSTYHEKSYSLVGTTKKGNNKASEIIKVPVYQKYAYGPKKGQTIMVKMNSEHLPQTDLQGRYIPGSTKLPVYRLAVTGDDGKTKSWADTDTIMGFLQQEQQLEAEINDAQDNATKQHLNGQLNQLAQNISNKYQRVLDPKTGRPAIVHTLERIYYGAEKTVTRRVFAQSSIHYSEKPKMVFFITPPHLTAYAKVILILLNQMFNYQVSMSYLTKANQKPLYETRYMLDEVGNLRSGGKGIPGLQTKESIGLGQGQYYTLILQTLQQLKDVYGQSVDKILTGNTRNIIFLQSTDPSLLKTLSDMSGITHRPHRSKSVQRNLNAHLNGHNSPKVSVSVSMKAEPLISQNMLRQNPRDSSIIFGHAHVIRSARQLTLPMSWRLYKHQLQPLDKKYTLKTIPNVSGAGSINSLLANQPDFFKMVKIRVRQAKMTPKIVQRYKKVHKLNDADLAGMDHEILSKELMEAVNAAIYKDDKQSVQSSGTPLKSQAEINAKIREKRDAEEKRQKASLKENKPVRQQEHKYDKFKASIHKKIYADGQLSRADLFQANGNDTEINMAAPTRAYDVQFANAYDATRNDFAVDDKFTVSRHGSLYLNGPKKKELWIASAFDKDTAYGQMFAKFKAGGDNGKFTQKFGNVTQDNAANGTKYHITNSMYRGLIRMPSWSMIANGSFEQALSRQLVIMNSVKSDQTA